MRDESHSAVTVLHTIGYEKTDLDNFLNRLCAEGIELLVDIRERPLSRKKGFSKNGLRDSVESLGIDYQHIKSLGDPKPGRDAARSGDYGLFEQIFSKHMSQPEAIEALARLSEDVLGKKACLMCFERDHTCCHRKIVSDMLSHILNVEIKHLKP